jgi:choline dehydrogenase
MRWNSALACLDPVRQRPNLTIMGDTLVDRVVVDGGRAVAVEVVVNGRRERIAAERIILAAGAYGSPAILLRSGIGPEDHLRAVDIEPVHPLEGVGRNLTDHPAVGLILDPCAALAGRMNDFLATTWLPDEQTLAKVRSRHCREAFDLHLYAVSTRSKGMGEWAYKIEVACVEPLSSGSLTLASAKPADAPRIDHGFLTDPDGHDLDVLLDGIEIAGRIMATDPFTALFGAGPGALSRDDLLAFTRGSVGIYYHPACSCRMGPASDPTAVVGPTGQVHGIAELYVCDASIFPVIPRANTNLPAVMLAEHLARGIGDA